jgi:hypothetical protein
VDQFERIDYYHTRFVEFDRACTVPGARILAATRFINALKDDIDSMGFYLEEPSRVLCKLLRDFPGAVTDPRHVTSINITLNVLQQTAHCDLKAFSSKPAISTESNNHSNGSTLAHIPIPLVCELPPVPGSNTAEFWGVATTLTVAPRVCETGQDHIIWNNSNVDIKSNRLRLLSNVAADVRMTALHVIYDLISQSASKSPWSYWSPGKTRQVDLERLGFVLSLPDKEMPVAGASISLALGAAMCGAMVGLTRGGNGFTPRSDIAWTGILKPSGEVSSVDRHSLREKIRATAANGLKGIVVARTQGSLACQFAEEIGWDGTVFTIGHLSEVISNSELMIESVLPTSIYRACHRLNLQHYSATALLAIVLLSLILYSPRILDGIGIHWFPWWRLTPQAEEIPQVKEFYQGFDLKIPRMADRRFVPENNRTFVLASIVPDVYDFREEGPYLVLGQTADCTSGKDGRLEIIAIPTKRVVAECNINSTWLPDDPGRENSANLYTLKQGIIADIDNDGSNEIVIAISFNPTSLCVLQILDHNLRCERALKHVGHLEHLDACDTDGDGRLEIVALGFHGPTAGMSLLVASIEDFYPAMNPEQLDPPSVYSSSGLSWDSTRQPCYAHFVLPYLDWMIDIPAADPWMQLGRFSLSMPAHNGAALRVRATASIGLSPSDILMDFDLATPFRLGDAFFGQGLINRVSELIKKGILPTDALSVFRQNVHDNMCSSTTIWTEGKPDESQ